MRRLLLGVLAPLTPCIEAAAEAASGSYGGKCNARAVSKPLAVDDNLHLCIMTNTGKESAEVTEFKIRVNDYASLRVTESAAKNTITGESLDKLKQDRYMWLTINNEESAVNHEKPGKVCHIKHEGNCANVVVETSCLMLKGLCKWDGTKPEGERCYGAIERQAQAVTCIQKYGDNDGVHIAFANVVIHMEMGLVVSAQLENNSSACGPEAQVVSYTKLGPDGAPDPKEDFTNEVNNVCNSKFLNEGDTSATNGDDADLKVIVSFSGTDRNGVYLKSSQLSYQRFDMNSIKTMWTSLKTKVTEYTSGTATEK